MKGLRKCSVGVGLALLLKSSALAADGADGEDVNLSFPAHDIIVNASGWGRETTFTVTDASNNSVLYGPETIATAGEDASGNSNDGGDGGDVVIQGRTVLFSGGVVIQGGAGSPGGPGVGLILNGGDGGNGGSISIRGESVTIGADTFISAFGGAGALGAGAPTVTAPSDTHPGGKGGNGGDGGVILIDGESIEGPLSGNVSGGHGGNGGSGGSIEVDLECGTGAASDGGRGGNGGAAGLIGFAFCGDTPGITASGLTCGGNGGNGGQGGSATVYGGSFLGLPGDGGDGGDAGCNTGANSNLALGYVAFDCLPVSVPVPGAGGEAGGGAEWNCPDTEGEGPTPLWGTDGQPGEWVSSGCALDTYGGALGGGESAGCPPPPSPTPNPSATATPTQAPTSTATATSTVTPTATATATATPTGTAPPTSTSTPTPAVTGSPSPSPCPLMLGDSCATALFVEDDAEFPVSLLCDTKETPWLSPCEVRRIPNLVDDWHMLTPADTLVEQTLTVTITDVVVGTSAPAMELWDGCGPGASLLACTAEDLEAGVVIQEFPVYLRLLGQQSATGTIVVDWSK